MAVVTAFGTLANTTDAGLTTYFRATGCTALTIADVLPLLSKITVYEQEYVIGEMKIWDTGTDAIEPNNCAMVRVMVYNDGWIVAWFDKESKNQFTGSSFTFVDAQTLAGFGSELKYPDQWNGCYLKITNSNGAGADDPDCPDDTIFTIRNTDSSSGQIQVHEDFSEDKLHFNTGNTYDVDVLMSNGNLVWWGHTASSIGSPDNLSNRLYRAIYEMWEELRYSSNTTDATDTAITNVFLDDGGSFTDYTTAFNDTGVNDVPLMPSVEEVDDAFYFGSSNKFNGLKLNIGTAGVGNTIVWEYWDGSAWSSLVVTDLTSGFTVLTVHNHKVDDTTNTITSTDATNQATVNTLLNEIKTDYNAHRVSTTFHEIADNTNVVSSADATDLSTSMTLANEIKIDYNAHRGQTGVHQHDDSENSVTASDAVNLATCITLANEIKGDYNAHSVSTQDANTVTFTPYDDWAKCFVNSSEQYWIRSRVSVATFTTQPLLTQGWVIVQDSLLYSDSNLGMYSFEDTAANYCLICGQSLYTPAWNGTKGYYFYNTVLPGKTVYNHVINMSYKHVVTSYERFGWIQFNINDWVFFYNDEPTSQGSYIPNGFRNYNIESEAATAAIQNVFGINAYGYTAGAPYPSILYCWASVLITS